MSVANAQTLHDGTPLFHWSPREVRDSITASGLRIRQPSPQGESFRMPYVAFGLDPMAAWSMSGQAFRVSRTWDLWMAHYGNLRGVCEVIPYDDQSPREVRCYRSVRQVQYVATRGVR